MLVHPAYLGAPAREEGLNSWLCGLSTANPKTFSSYTLDLESYQPASKLLCGGKALEQQLADFEEIMGADNLTLSQLANPKGKKAEKRTVVRA